MLQEEKKLILLQRFLHALGEYFLCVCERPISTDYSMLELK